MKIYLPIFIVCFFTCFCKERQTISRELNSENISSSANPDHVPDNTPPKKQETVAEAIVANQKVTYNEKKDVTSVTRPTTTEENPLHSSSIESKKKILRLPIDDKDKMTIIQNACPNCKDGFVVPCGSDRLGLNRRFKKNFFIGTPARGFFISPPIFDKETIIRALRDSSNVKKAESTLHKILSSMSLYVVENDFSAAKNLGSPSEVKVNIPQKYHFCLKNNREVWGSCVSSSYDKECCHKHLGIIEIEIVWKDSATNEIYRFVPTPNTGYSSAKFMRKNRDEKTTLYWCIMHMNGQFE